MVCCCVISKNLKYEEVIARDWAASAIEKKNPVRIAAEVQTLSERAIVLCYTYIARCIQVLLPDSNAYLTDRSILGCVLG